MGSLKKVLGWWEKKRLIARLKKPSCDYDERKAIVESLCERGDISCLDILVEQPLKFHRADYNWAVERIAAKFGSQATDVLIDLLASKRIVPFQTTMDILGHIGDENAYLTALVRVDPKTLRKGEWQSRHARVTDALKKMGNRATEPLIRCLSDDDARVRFIAAGHLAEYGDGRAIGPLRKLQNETKSNGRYDVSDFVARLEKRVATHQPTGRTAPAAPERVTLFEVEVPDQAVFYCSDNDCPCGSPGAEIRRGEGYLYISADVVEAREDALTLAQLEAKLRKLQQATGAFLFFDQGTIWPILMCEQAARRRGLNLAVAAADARQLFATGRVPLRVTPQA